MQFCEVPLAEQIANSVAALHASRQPDAARRSAERAHPDFFSALWHGMFGLRQ
ncbi:hypothetical protein [Burkholderia stagnalis]